MPSTEDRLITLDNSLGELKPDHYAQWSIAKVYNALLDAAKSEHPDDPIVQAIDPAEEAAMSSTSTMTVGTMRASIAQLVSSYS